MFQDGSVKAILAKSPYSSLRRRISFAYTANRQDPGLTQPSEMWPHFASLSWSKPITSSANSTFEVPHLQCLSDTSRSSAEITSFYRFLLNDFKSFNSLFKVLFIFPSQYLFAIGFPSIFSLRRSLSPIWAAIPSNPTLRDPVVTSMLTNYGAFTLFGVLFQRNLCDQTHPLSIPLDYNS